MAFSQFRVENEIPKIGWYIAYGRTKILNRDGQSDYSASGTALWTSLTRRSAPAQTTYRIGLLEQTRLHWAKLMSETSYNTTELVKV